MGKPITSSMISLAMVPAILFSMAGPVFAQEDDIEALQAKIADLQSTVDDTMQGREYLFNELTEANNRADAAEAERDQLTRIMEEKAANEDSLNKQLASVTVGRDFLAERATTALAASAEKDRELERLKKSLTMANRGRNYLKERNLALTAESGKKEAELARVKKSLTMANRGRSYLKEQNLALTAKSDKNDRELARVKKSLTMANRGRSYLKEQNLALTAKSDKNGRELARVKKSLTMANRGRSYLKEQNLALAAESDEKDAELDRMAEVAFAQINSAIAERDAARESTKLASTSNAWAVTNSESLSGAISSIADISATEDNKVKIEVGNSGLFRSGGTILTENGQNILLQLGDVLADLKDTHINIVGHTDNLPVGSGGRFASNAELSFARASSALRFLNRNAGVSADNLTASGLGDKYPIATNDTAEGRSANRRVEILLSQK